jgi:hypothetical protein
VDCPKTPSSPMDSAQTLLGLAWTQNGYSAVLSAKNSLRTVLGQS